MSTQKEFLSVSSGAHGWSGAAGTDMAVPCPRCTRTLGMEPATSVSSQARVTTSYPNKKLAISWRGWPVYIPEEPSEMSSVYKKSLTEHAGRNVLEGPNITHSLVTTPFQHIVNVNQYPNVTAR